MENFEKQLPQDDTLARAVGLESTKKGARLMIEPKLAETILSGHTEWLTIEGYVNNQNVNPYSFVGYDDIRRRIIPTPEQDAYECLYFWACHSELEHQNMDYEVKIKDLEEIKGMLGEHISIHYKDTIELLRRCNRRQDFTKRALIR